MLPRKGNMILKVDRQGFLKVPISGQKVMLIMAQFHLKHCLTFARTPCTYHCAIISAWKGLDASHNPEVHIGI